MVSRERRGIRTRSQREIPAAVPALASCRCWFHVPNRHAGYRFADTNPCNIGRPPPEHVDVGNDLTILREPETKRRGDEMKRLRGTIATQCGEEGSEARREAQ